MAGDAKKLGDYEKVTTLNAGAYVTGVYADTGKVVLIDKASLAEVVRAEMATTKTGQKGLLDGKFINAFSGLCASAPVYEGDLNSLYTEVGEGISSFTTTANTANTPGTHGTLIHTQRVGKGSAALSQVIGQIFIGGNKHITARIGVGGSNNVITFSNWSQII